MDLLSTALSAIKAERSHRRLEDHPRTFTQRNIYGVLLGKPTALQGYRDSVPLLPALSAGCVNEGNRFVFLPVSPKGSLLVRTLNIQTW